MGANAKKEPQSNTEEASTAKTSTNHTALNVKELGFDPKTIRLSDAISGFKQPSLDSKHIAKEFQELLSGMKNIENTELLRAQAETVLSKELRAKFEEVSKDYVDLSPESQAKVDEWRENLTSQSRELAKDFENALRTKLE